MKHLRMRGWRWRNFAQICLGVLSLAGAFALAEAGLFFRDARTDLSPIADSAQRTIYTADLLLRQADLTIKQINIDAIEFSLAADAEATYWQKTQLQVYKLITDTKEIMVRTDRSLNDVLVPRLAGSLDASRDLQVSAMRNLTDASAKIDDTIDALAPPLQKMIDNGIRATAAASTAMADPAIHETLDHMDASAGNLEGMSADGKKMTVDLAAFTHRELAPVHGTWHVIKSFLMEFAGPAAQVATAAK